MSFCLGQVFGVCLEVSAHLFQDFDMVFQFYSQVVSPLTMSIPKTFPGHFFFYKKGPFPNW